MALSVADSLNHVLPFISYSVDLSNNSVSISCSCSMPALAVWTTLFLSVGYQLMGLAQAHGEVVFSCPCRRRKRQVDRDTQTMDGGEEVRGPQRAALLRKVTALVPSNGQRFHTYRCSAIIGRPQRSLLFCEFCADLESRCEARV